jgi:polysaccharide biosynthesis/export protein VpsN
MILIMNKFLKFSFVALIAAIFVIGCSSTPDQPAQSSTGTVNPNPLASPMDQEAIQRGDTLTVRITGITPEIVQPELQVNEMGMISLPFINNVKAEGLTIGVLQKKIERAYLDGGYYTKLSVSVTPGLRVLYVHGEVKMPGKVIWTSGLTVGKAISLAGGYTDYAGRSHIEVTRKGSTFSVNLKAAEEDPSKDVPVYPRDDIKVNRSFL